jgi:hypothetical protein
MTHEDAKALWDELRHCGAAASLDKLQGVGHDPLPIIEKHLAQAFELGRADGRRDLEPALKIAYGRGFVEGKDEGLLEERKPKAGKKK